MGGGVVERDAAFVVSSAEEPAAVGMVLLGSLRERGRSRDVRGGTGGRGEKMILLEGREGGGSRVGSRGGG